MIFTPISDSDRTADLIDCLQIEHYRILLTICHAYISPAVERAKIATIFAEGLLVEVEIAQQVTRRFVPFLDQRDEVEDRLWRLAQAAADKLGRPLRNQQQQYFRLLAKQMVSANICRLTLASEQSLPQQEAGYAWCFSLRAFKQKQWLDPEIQPRRYYTLRHAPQPNVAWVDIFLHGDSHGSIWVGALQVGDWVHSSVVYQEQTEHLAQGQCVLIGDETGLPTIAKLLELWGNPCAPIVFSLTADLQDQAYLNDVALPHGTRHYRLPTREGVQAVIAHLAHHSHIDNVWSALEQQQAKDLRHYFRHERSLSGKHNRIKGYWIATKNVEE